MTHKKKKLQTLTAVPNEFHSLINQFKYCTIKSITVAQLISRAITHLIGAIVDLTILLV